MHIVVSFFPHFCSIEGAAGVEEGVDKLLYNSTGHLPLHISDYK